MKFKVGDGIRRKNGRFIRIVLAIENGGYTLSSPNYLVGSFWLDKHEVEKYYSKISPLEHLL